MTDAKPMTARRTNGRTAPKAIPETQGIARAGEWAHVRYHKRQHLVAVVRDDVPPWEQVLLACGRTIDRAAIWHDVGPPPHLPRCKTCERSVR